MKLFKYRANGKNFPEVVRGNGTKMLIIVKEEEDAPRERNARFLEAGVKWSQTCSEQL